MNIVNRVLIAFTSIVLATASAHAATFTVTNTNDAGAGSLRAAIAAANANANAPTIDLIDFNIPGAGPHTIQPVSNLPAIRDPVVIDGYTQPGASVNTNPVGLGLNTVLQIEIDGSLLGEMFPVALNIRSDNTTVRGLVINRVPRRFDFKVGTAIQITNVPPIGNIILEGNFIGTDVTGTMALGLDEIAVAIGTGNNRIGGTTPAARNLISGNFTGIVVVAPDGNVFQGNLIGTDVTGTVALGNITNGLAFVGGPTNNLVGGTASGARNVISGNGFGIAFSLANGNRVQGNFIGTDVTGTMALGIQSGITITGNNNTIGGTAPGEGNVISGNAGLGVFIAQGSTGNRVEGNFVGTDETGSLDLGNDGEGVLIESSPNNTIGGMVPGAGNIIAYNGRGGVYVRFAASSGNAILSNAIFANDAAPTFPGLGIDLTIGLPRDGVTPNDLGDGDTGGNNLQNFPELSFAGSTSSTTEVDGTLSSTPMTAFTLQFFSNSACDPSDHGEGEIFLGSADVTTDLVGDVSFSAVLPTPASVGDVITMTATDPNGNTSEFSDCSIDEAEVVALDSDGDGVNDEEDFCPDTVIPEGVPTVRLGINRWALVDDDLDFDTTDPKGKGPGRSYLTTDTAGCSCEQIIAAQGLGKGHTKFGCSISAMDNWVELVTP